jgi:hypothetical protein
MQQHDHPVWEPVQDIVEPFLKPDHRHHWPLSPTFPLDIRFLRLNRNLDVPPHRPDHLEIVYVEKGEVGYEVGNRTYMLHPGDIIVVGDKILHRCLRTSLAHSDVHSTVFPFGRNSLFRARLMETISAICCRFPSKAKRFATLFLLKGGLQKMCSGSCSAYVGRRTLLPIMRASPHELM